VMSVSSTTGGGTSEPGTSSGGPSRRPARGAARCATAGEGGAGSAEGARGPGSSTRSTSAPAGRRSADGPGGSGTPGRSGVRRGRHDHRRGALCVVVDRPAMDLRLLVVSAEEGKLGPARLQLRSSRTSSCSPPHPNAPSHIGTVRASSARDARQREPALERVGPTCGHRGPAVNSSPYEGETP
jgi:hypothetical protein